MFTWICPKCGKEVPPAYSECPNCSSPQTATPPAARPPDAPKPAAALHAKPASTRMYVLTALFGAACVIIALTVVVLLRSQRTSQATAPVPAPAPLQNAAPAPTPQVDPLLKNVELTGFRLTEDPKQKPQLQFVIVNHSAADFGEIKAKVNLRAVNMKPEDPPAGTFSFVTTLGPYEAKDLRVPLETKLRVYELPDWQLVRAEIAAP